MASEFLSKMTLTKWIIAAVIAAIIVLFGLLKFTSFQLPQNLLQNEQEPRVGGGLEGVDGNTLTCTNLDRAYDKIHGRPECSDYQNEGGVTDEK